MQLPMGLDDATKREIASVIVKAMKKATGEQVIEFATKVVEPNAELDSDALTAATVRALGLSERELALCRSNKIDPRKYAQTRAAIRARSSKKKTGGARVVTRSLHAASARGNCAHSSVIKLGGARGIRPYCSSCGAEVAA